jgi:hypothetical protein
VIDFNAPKINGLQARPLANTKLACPGRQIGVCSKLLHPSDLRLSSQIHLMVAHARHSCRQGGPEALRA